MAAIKIEKKVQLNKFEIIKYQLIHYCFIEKIKLSHTEVDCLAFLGELGKIRLSEFGKKAADRGILGNAISVNNCLSKLEGRGLFIKSEGGKKMIFLNPKLEIKSEGTIILDLKIFTIEAGTAPGNIQNNRKKVELA